MGSDELTRLFSGENISQASQSFPLLVIDIYPVAQIRALFVHRHARTKFTDVTDRIWPSGVHIESTWSMHVVPLRLIFAVAIEHLHAMILAVGDIDPAFFVSANVVHDVELTWIAPRFAPREKQLSVGRILVYSGVAVAVRNIYVPLRGEGHMRAAIERFAALIGRRLVWHAQGENDFSIQAALSHGVVAVVAQENRFVGTQRRTVRPFEYALAPGTEKPPIPVEDDDRMRTTGKTIHLIFFIHCDRGHFFEGPAVRQFSPALDDFVAKFSVSHCYAHRNLLITPSL